MLFEQLKELFRSGEGYDTFEPITMTNILLRHISSGCSCLH